MAGRELSERQRALAGLVAAGEPPSKAAGIVGVSPRTARRWAQKPEFRALVDELQGEATASVKRKLRALGESAARTLSEVMGDPEAPASPRVSAAGRILDAIFRLDEMEKLDQIDRRLGEIEARLGRGGP